MPEPSSRRAVRPAAVPLRPPRRARSPSPREHHGGAVDLSIGTPCDPPPPRGRRGARPRPTPSAATRPSIGTLAYRRGGRRLDRPALRRRASTPAHLAACVGTKEFVAGLPHLLRLRRPDRDTVLYPAVSYPSYAMGATLAGCRAVPVPVDDRLAHRPRRHRPGRRGAGAVPVGQHAGQPGRRPRRPRRRRGLGPRPRRAGLQRRVLRRVHLGRPAPRSILDAPAPTAWWRCTRCRSARTSPVRGPASTPATPSWCTTSREVRKHQGLMVPGPGAGGGGRRLGRRRARRRAARPLPRTRSSCSPALLDRLGIDGADARTAAFYLWVPAPDGDAWALADRLAERRRRGRQPRRVLRRGRRRPRAHRRGAARRSPRGAASHRAARRPRPMSRADRMTRPPTCSRSRPRWSTSRRRASTRRRSSTGIEAELRAVAAPRGRPASATTSWPAPTLGRSMRLILGGHTDTVPANGNAVGHESRATRCGASARPT